MIRLEGQSLLVTSYGKTVATIERGYRLGTAFTVKFVAQGGQFTVFYQNRQVARLALALNGCYFKAGCYTQSSTAKSGDKPSDYGEVVVYDLKVTHA